MNLHLSGKITAALLALLFVASLFVLPRGASADQADVRVLLSVESTDKLSVTVKGSYSVSESQTDFTGGTLTFSTDGRTITVSHNKLGEIFSGKRITVLRSDPKPSAGSLSFKVNGSTRSYLGSLTVTASGGSLRVVNTVPLTQYLYGVVGYEMSNTWPVEALKAQAVAAKNYVLARTGSGGSYDVRDTAVDQVYKGYLSSMTNVISAVDSVEDKALYLGDLLIPCYYSASNGGYTILPSANWGETVFDAAYAEGTDPFDLRNTAARTETLYIPQNLAKRKFSSSALYQFIMDRLNVAAQKEGAFSEGYVFDEFREISSIISTDKKGNITPDGNHSQIILTVAAHLVPDPDTVDPKPTPAPPKAETETAKESIDQPTESIETDAKDPTDSEAKEKSSDAEPPSVAGSSDAEWTENIVVTIPFADMVNAGLFTDTSLRIFHVQSAENGWTLFHGRFGHGVGMSQRGAQQMAKEGWTYDKILSFYYPGAVLKSGKIDSSSIPVIPAQDNADTGDTEEPPQTESTEPDEPAETPAVSTEEMEQENGTVLTRTDVFSGADRSTTLVETVSAGTKLFVRSAVDGWYLIRDGNTGKVGYVPYSTVSVTGDRVLASGIITGSLVNLRSGPGTEYESLGRLDENDKVSILELGKEWYRIRNSTDAIGYVSGQYVRLFGSSGTPVLRTEDPDDGQAVIIQIAPTPTPVPTSVPFRASGTVNTESVHFRTGPSVSADSLGEYGFGTKFRILAKAGNWYQAELEATGQSGYVYIKYITLASGDQAEDEQIAAVLTKSGAILRKAPSSSAKSVSSLSCGALVTVLGTEGSWYRVLVASTGETGYVLGSYLSFDIFEKEMGNTGSSRQATVCTGLMRMLDRPDAEKGKTLQLIRLGFTVTVRSISDGWACILFNGTEGYCQAKYLTMQ